MIGGRRAAWLSLFEPPVKYLCNESVSRAKFKSIDIDSKDRWSRIYGIRCIVDRWLYFIAPRWPKECKEENCKNGTKVHSAMYLVSFLKTHLKVT